MYKYIACAFGFFLGNKTFWPGIVGRIILVYFYFLLKHSFIMRSIDKTRVSRRREHRIFNDLFTGLITNWWRPILCRINHTSFVFNWSRWWSLEKKFVEESQRQTGNNKRHHIRDFTLSDGYLRWLVVWATQHSIYFAAQSAVINITKIDTKINSIIMENGSSEMIIRFMVKSLHGFWEFSIINW